MSFLDSAFPAVINTTKFDLIMYNRIVNAITDMTAVIPVLFDSSGDLKLLASKVVKFGGVSKLSFSTPDVVIDRLEVLDSPWTTGAISPGGDCTVSNDATVADSRTLALSGDLTITGVIDVDVVAGTSFTIAQIAEPGDPPDEKAVLWCDDGSGPGDVGDIMIKIQHGSVVKSTTLVDFA